MQDNKDKFQPGDRFKSEFRQGSSDNRGFVDRVRETWNNREAERRTFLDQQSNKMRTLQDPSKGSESSIPAPIFNAIVNPGRKPGETTLTGSGARDRAIQSVLTIALPVAPLASAIGYATAEVSSIAKRVLDIKDVAAGGGTQEQAESVQARLRKVAQAGSISEPQIASATVKTMVRDFISDIAKSSKSGAVVTAVAKTVSTAGSAIENIEIKRMAGQNVESAKSFVESTTPAIAQGLASNVKLGRAGSSLSKALSPAGDLVFKSQAQAETALKRLEETRPYLKKTY